MNVKQANAASCMNIGCMNLYTVCLVPERPAEASRTARLLDHGPHPILAAEPTAWKGNGADHHARARRGTEQWVSMQPELPSSCA